MPLLPWRRPHAPEHKHYVTRPTVLVVSRTLLSALNVSELIEAVGVHPRFLAADSIREAEDVFPRPAGALLLRELDTPDKLHVCHYLRHHEELTNLPIAVVCTLLENTVDFPANVLVRPPTSIGEGLRELLRLIPESAPPSVP